MDVPADLDLHWPHIETRAVRGDSAMNYSNLLKQMQFEDENNHNQGQTGMRIQEKY